MVKAEDFGPRRPGFDSRESLIFSAYSMDVMISDGRTQYKHSFNVIKKEKDLSIICVLKIRDSLGPSFCLLRIHLTLHISNFFRASIKKNFRISIIPFYGNTENNRLNSHIPYFHITGTIYGNMRKFFLISVKFSRKTEMQSCIKLMPVLRKYGITEIQKCYKIEHMTKHISDRMFCQPETESVNAVVGVVLSL